MIIEFKPDNRGQKTTFPEGAFFLGKLPISELPRTTDLTGFRITQAGAHQVINVMMFNENPVWGHEYPPSTDPIPDVTLPLSSLKKGILFQLAELDAEDQPLRFVPGRLTSI